MHHKAVLSKAESSARPFRAQCSCGPAGDFVEKETARGFLVYHLAKQGGLSTSEFIDETVEPEPEPEVGSQNMVSEGAPAETAT